MGNSFCIISSTLAFFSHVQVGRREVDVSDVSWNKILAQNPELEPGGRYRPRECVARNKVAVIVPYRDRERHLRSFLYNLHPMLKRQQLDYGIYVIDQIGKLPCKKKLLIRRILLTLTMKTVPECKSVSFLRVHLAFCLSFDVVHYHQ